MGRVYDALKRAESARRDSKPANSSASRNGEPDNIAYFVPKNGHGHPWEQSPFTGMPPATNSASTAQTAGASVGPALPGGPASRDAGATLGAVGSTRAAEFSSREVSVTRVEPHLVAITAPRSAECELYRSLRTRLLQADSNPRAFVITSAGVGEGKTLTAVNMAWLLAQTDGVKALLIDADLRLPRAADYLGVETDFGLSEVLTGGTKLADAIIKLQPSGLHLLPGGASREDVAELLSGPRFGHLLDEARKCFDYIIIDAPPLGVFTDANLLIKSADAALLVVRATKTRYAVVDQLLEQLPRERMLGVVLNGAEINADDTAYYYQPRHQRATSRPKTARVTEVSEQPEMIYLEEDVVS